MKIYKLTVSEVAADPTFAISSAYVAPRTERNVEYYSSLELAEKRKNEIYDGVIKLVGFIPKLEARISVIDVRES